MARITRRKPTPPRRLHAADPFLPVATGGLIPANIRRAFMPVWYSLLCPALAQGQRKVERGTPTGIVGDPQSPFVRADNRAADR